jgi:two-component system OmpR family sensor kinase
MTRAWSLRGRLTAGVLLLTALGLSLAAAASTVLLRDYLLTQVDLQLAGTSRIGTPPGAAPGQPSIPPQGQGLPSPFVLTQLDAAGVVVQQSRGSQVAEAPAPDLSGLTLERVRQLGTAPFDVSGVGDSAYSYRASAVPLADGTGSVVVAISTESIDATTQRAAVAASAVGLLMLGLVGLLAGGVVRVGLRPLEGVERTAERIAGGDLTQRVPPLPVRTEIGRLSEALNGMLGQIERAFDERAASEERLRRFVADASHELRTPLTTIRGYAELARAGALTDERDRARAVGRIEAEAVRMGVLVDDLLLLARLDQQRPLDRATLDLVPLVLAAADGLRAAAPDRVVTVRAVGVALVDGDAHRLRQVLDNLVSNARVHTAAATPVTVTVETEPEWVVVAVSDAGPGMSGPEVARAFERFYRGDPSRTRRTGAGTGLGLPIAAAIVESHGGTLGLESSSQGGTTVTVRLPLAAQAPTDTLPGAVPATAARDTGRRG